MNIFNKKINRHKTDCIKWDCQNNPDAIPFWIADSDYQSPKPVIKALNKRVNHGVFGYTSCGEDYKQAVVDWYNKSYNCHLLLDDVIPSIGVMVSLRMILETFTNMNDSIVIQPPVYQCFFRLIKNANRQVIENPLIRINNETEHTMTYKMDLVHLENIFKAGTKVMILCSPHNPIGRVWDEQEIEQLVLLVKKYNVLLITDEIHSDFMINNHTFYSMAHKLNDYENLIICNAPSKSFNIAGLQASYVIIRNQSIKTQYEKTCESFFIDGPNDLAITALLASYHFGFNYIKEQNKHITYNYNLFKKAFTAEVPKAYITELQGTYLIFLDLTYLNKTSNELVKYFEDHHLTFNSGSNFYSLCEGYIRVNLACPTSQLIVGLNMLIEAIKELEYAAR